METSKMAASRMQRAGGRDCRGAEPVARAGGAGARNTEKSKSVHQKVAERFERVRAFVIARPGLFARQGAVVATSRTYRGRRLGPYFQLAWREAGRLRRLYLGRSLELADRVRELLERLQRPARERRVIVRLKRQTRSALRRWVDEMRPFLARWGLEFKGYELRGVRRSLRRYAQAFAPASFVLPPPAPRPRVSPILRSLRPLSAAGYRRAVAARQRGRCAGGEGSGGGAARFSGMAAQATSRL